MRVSPSLSLSIYIYIYVFIYSYDRCTPRSRSSAKAPTEQYHMLICASSMDSEGCCVLSPRCISTTCLHGFWNSACFCSKLLTMNDSDSQAISNLVRTTLTSLITPITPLKSPKTSLNGATRDAFQRSSICCFDPPPVLIRLLTDGLPYYRRNSLTVEGHPLL